jgi:hypothetical protein
VGAPEHRRAQEELANDGKVGKAGPRQHEPRQARRGGAHLRVGERRREERVLGEEKMAVQAPRMGFGHVKQNDEGQQLHGRNAAGAL